PDPVPRIRLSRDVLRLPIDSANLNASHWVTELAREQRPDGGWGRFHSQDTRANRRVPTTEFGVERALALGLDASHPILEKAVRYLVGLLQGSIGFPDPPEENDRWTTGARLFAASALARIQPNHPALNETLELWSAIAEKTFASGAYDPDAEVEAHRQLTGATVKGSYLRMRGKYQLALLGARPNLLPRKIESRLLNWLSHSDEGLGYLDMPLAPLRWGFTPSQIDRWFASLEIVSRFSGWRNRSKDIAQWLWKQRGADGLWDFGAKASFTSAMPFSENWQKKNARKFDWTTRTLILLERFK
ncbi:MAG: hypothetical protein AB1750_17830, partial [Chloroflexota bacterium]